MRSGGCGGRGSESGERQNEAEKGEQISARGDHGIKLRGKQALREGRSGQVEKASLVDRWHLSAVLTESRKNRFTTDRVPEVPAASPAAGCVRLSPVCR